MDRVSATRTADSHGTERNPETRGSVVAEELLAARMAMQSGSTAQDAQRRAMRALFADAATADVKSPLARIASKPIKADRPLVRVRASASPVGAGWQADEAPAIRLAR